MLMERIPYGDGGHRLSMAGGEEGKTAASVGTDWALKIPPSVFLRADVPCRYSEQFRMAPRTLRPACETLKDAVD
jgi:hypothetical protein